MVSLASCCLISLAVAQELPTALQKSFLPGPFFWHQKKSVEQSLKRRQIVVSVTRQQERWHFKGAGLVALPVAQTQKAVRQYDQLSAFPQYFSQVRWESQEKLLHLQVHFLSRTRALTVRLEPESGENLFFRIEEGWFQGLEGVLMMRSADEGKSSEISLVAASSTTLKWIPDFVFSLSAEAVMQHVAAALRDWMEGQHATEQHTN
jgi:hypothetical protein